MRGFAQKQISIHLHTQLEKAFDLLHKGKGIDDNSVSDEAHFPRTKDSRWNKMQDVFLRAYEYGMAGVIPALGTHHHIGLLGEDVDNLSFSFIAPLGAH
jgi:hypothetical protein